MTASEYIKSKGLPSLAYVAKAVGRHPDTLHNWYKDSFKLFEIVVAGVAIKFFPNLILKDLSHAKPVAWCDEDGNIISEYESVGQAARYTHVYKAGISRCCKGLAKVAGGARWKYIDCFGEDGNTTNLKYEAWLYARRREEREEE